MASLRSKPERRTALGRYHYLHPPNSYCDPFTGSATCRNTPTKGSQQNLFNTSQQVCPNSEFCFFPCRKIPHEFFIAIKLDDPVFFNDAQKCSKRIYATSLQNKNFNFARLRNHKIIETGISLIKQIPWQYVILQQLQFRALRNLR